MMETKETNEETIREEDEEDEDMSASSSLRHIRIPRVVRVIIIQNKDLIQDSIINTKDTDIPGIQLVARSSSPVRSVWRGHSIRNDK